MQMKVTVGETIVDTDKVQDRIGAYAACNCEVAAPFQFSALTVPIRWPNLAAGAFDDPNWFARPSERPGPSFEAAQERCRRC